MAACVIGDVDSTENSKFLPVKQHDIDTVYCKQKQKALKQSIVQITHKITPSTLIHMQSCLTVDYLVENHKK